jgi:hypothetical protein
MLVVAIKPKPILSDVVLTVIMLSVASPFQLAIASLFIFKEIPTNKLERLLMSRIFSRVEYL